MRPAGYAIDVRTSLHSAVEGSLVVMEFQGQCSSQAQNSPLSPAKDLATTSVLEGKVLPFTQIHCSTIRQTLAAALKPMMPGMQDNILGRSIGRILAHELYHILANNMRHSERGIAKSQFSAADLMSSQVSFDEVALDRMSHEPPPAILAGGGEE